MRVPWRARGTQLPHHSLLNTLKTGSYHSKSRDSAAAAPHAPAPWRVGCGRGGAGSDRVGIYFSRSRYRPCRKPGRGGREGSPSPAGRGWEPPAAPGAVPVPRVPPSPGCPRLTSVPPRTPRVPRVPPRGCPPVPRVPTGAPRPAPPGRQRLPGRDAGGCGMRGLRDTGGLRGAASRGGLGLRGVRLHLPAGVRFDLKPPPRQGAQLLNLTLIYCF